MGSAVATFVWRDVVGKRWIRCAVWQAAISSVVWLIWEFLLRLWSRRAGASGSALLFAVMWASMRVTLFQMSQMCFLLGQTFISESEESEAISTGELWIELGKRAWRSVGPYKDSPAIDTSEFRRKLRTKANQISFAILCFVSGFLAFIALFSSLLSSVGWNWLDIGLRGATLGLMYAAFQSYQRKLSLSFPIIQRRLYFSFKMGIPPAVTASCKLALALVPTAEAVSQIYHYGYGVSGASALMDYTSVLLWQPWFAAGAFIISFSWEICHHLVQVLHTKLYEFAPPLGSTSAEQNPTDLLLMILEDQETVSLVQYHGFLDLCNVSETNVDTWRRAAIFEESGDTYRRVINLGLKRLDDLTIILAQGLEVGEADKRMDSRRPLIESRDAVNKSFQIGDLSSSSQDFQFCALCARIVASLTSRSRSEDKYGVAQLNCCNVAVVSSLLSCLLVLEVYLGRRSGARGVMSVPNSMKWTVPSKVSFVDSEKRKFNPLGKRTLMHKKAYALADVVRTCMYQIVYAFSDEMVLVGSSGKGYWLAVRDWLSQKKPLYGTNDMHLQRLIAFLPYQID